MAEVLAGLFVLYWTTCFIWYELLQIFLDFLDLIDLQVENVWNDVLVWTCLYFERYLNELEPPCMHLSTRLARTWPQSSEKTKSRRCRGDSREGRTFNWIKSWLWWHVMTWGFSCLKSLRFWYMWPIGVFFLQGFFCLPGRVARGGSARAFWDKVWCAGNVVTASSIEWANKRQTKTCRSASFLRFANWSTTTQWGSWADCVQCHETTYKTYRLKIRLPFAFEADFGQSTGQSPSSVWKGISVGGEHNLERCFGDEICRNAMKCMQLPALHKSLISKFLHVDSFGLWEHPRSLEAFPFSPNWQLLPRTQLHEGEVVQCIRKGWAEWSCGLLVATCGNAWDNYPQGSWGTQAEIFWIGLSTRLQPKTFYKGDVIIQRNDAADRHVGLVKRS